MYYDGLMLYAVISHNDRHMRRFGSADCFMGDGNAIYTMSERESKCLTTLHILYRGGFCIITNLPGRSSVGGRTYRWTFLILWLLGRIFGWVRVCVLVRLIVDELGHVRDTLSHLWAIKL